MLSQSGSFSKVIGCFSAGKITSVCFRFYSHINKHITNKDVASIFVTDGNVNLIGGYVGPKQKLFKGCKLFFDSWVIFPTFGYYLHP